MIKPNARFLVVDDYSTIRSLVTSQLLEFGFDGNFIEAENADQAIEVLETHEVDFVISDWNMPGKTGLDLLKWVRANEKFVNLPFLILTTENEQEKILDAISEGASNFLLKPWEEEDLSEKIGLCFQQHGG